VFSRLFSAGTAIFLAGFLRGAQGTRRRISRQAWDSRVIDRSVVRVTAVYSFRTSDIGDSTGRSQPVLPPPKQTIRCGLFRLLSTNIGTGCTTTTHKPHSPLAYTTPTKKHTHTAVETAVEKAAAPAPACTHTKPHPHARTPAQQNAPLEVTTRASTKGEP